MLSGRWATLALMLTLSGCRTPITGCGDPCGGDATCGSCRPAWYLTPFRKLGVCDGTITRVTARNCAIRNLHAFNSGGAFPLTADFRDGFIASHVDVAQGGKPLLPPAPPPRYWHAYYRSPVGQQNVQNWYEGYQQGLEYAVPALGSWNRVAVRAADVPNRNRAREIIPVDAFVADQPGLAPVNPLLPQPQLPPTGPMPDSYQPAQQWSQPTGQPPLFQPPLSPSIQQPLPSAIPSLTPQPQPQWQLPPGPGVPASPLNDPAGMGPANPPIDSGGPATPSARRDLFWNRSPAGLSRPAIQQSPATNVGFSRQNDYGPGGRYR